MVRAPPIGPCEFAVRSALTRATESLEDVIRIAVSRGGRLLERDG
ncbi:hypothetical protein [Streptomyces sp. NPDC058457]